MSGGGCPWIEKGVFLRSLESENLVAGVFCKRLAHERLCLIAPVHWFRFSSENAPVRQGAVDFSDVEQIYTLMPIFGWSEYRILSSPKRLILLPKRNSYQWHLIGHRRGWGIPIFVFLPLSHRMVSPKICGQGKLKEKTLRSPNWSTWSAEELDACSYTALMTVLHPGGNMEPENRPLEDDFPLRFQVPC